MQALRVSSRRPSPLASRPHPAYTAAMAAPASAKSTAKPPAAQRLISAETELDAFLQSGPLPAVFTVISGRFESENRREEPPVADPRALLAAARKIEAVALAGGDRALDYVQIDYLDGDHQATGVHWVIAQELRATSLFGGTRVVTVTHAETMVFDGGKGKGKARRGKAKSSVVEADPVERLLQQAETWQGPPPWVLIVVVENLRRDHNVFKTLARAGVVVEVAPFTKQALQTYLEKEGAKYKIKVDRSVGQIMWDRLGGGNAARLRNEADRLLLQVGPGGTISEALVLAEVPMDRDAATWALTGALREDDRVRAMTLVHMLVGSAQASDQVGRALGVLSGLTNYYRNLSSFLAMTKAGVPQAEIQFRLNQRDFGLRNLAAHGRKMRMGQLERALAAVVAADPLVKSSPVRWLERLVLALLRDEPLRVPSTELADTFGQG